MKAPALFLAACSGGGGGNMMGDDGVDPLIDAPPPEPVMDAPPSNVPAMVTIKGKTTERGLSGTSNVAQVPP